MKIGILDRPNPLQNKQKTPSKHKQETSLNQFSHKAKKKKKKQKKQKKKTIQKITKEK